jgi:hypothetical protein
MQKRYQKHWMSGCQKTMRKHIAIYNFYPHYFGTIGAKFSIPNAVIFSAIGNV